MIKRKPDYQTFNSTENGSDRKILIKNLYMAITVNHVPCKVHVLQQKLLSTDLLSHGRCHILAKPRLAKTRFFYPIYEKMFSLVNFAFFGGFDFFYANPIPDSDMNRSLVRLAAGSGRGEAELGHHSEQIQGRGGTTSQTSAQVSIQVL